MALTPITFKADLGADNAKGHIRPQDFAALVAFSNPKEAGILEISGNDCEQFGAISIVGNTAQVTFHKGYIIILGRAIYIDEGTQVAFNLPSSGTVNGVLGIKINLAEDKASEVTWFQKADAVVKNDLLKDPQAGVYEFVLYNYTATSTSFELGAKTTEIIPKLRNFLDQYTQGENFVTQPRGDNSNKLATTAFVNDFLDGLNANVVDLKPGTDINCEICGIVADNLANTTGLFTTINESLNNCKQISLIPAFKIFVGKISNPSGLNGNRWLRVTIPGLNEKTKYVFASLDGNDFSYSAGEVGVYSDASASVYILRKGTTDRPNLNFMILAF